MRRHLFAFAAAASFLLCLATVVLWVQSYWAGDAIEVSFHDTTLGDAMEGDRYKAMCVRAADGLFMLGRGFSYEQDRFHRTITSWVERPPWNFRDDSHVWRRFGFLIDSGPDGLIYVSFPFWVTVIGFAVLPAVRIAKRWKHHSGSCPTCGYNLVGNTSGTCPECGTPIQSPVV